MGELLLCSQELAFVPYYIETISLNVYSLEELCYYLKHNIDLVEPSFMDKELVSWIKTELKLTTLAERLSRLIQEGSSLSEFVGQLANGCNYCTKEEIAKMQEKLADFENKTELECRKIRADRLLEKKRYQTCIIEYLRLLEYAEIKGMLEGNIYHNLGTAYAGLFMFQEAARYYEKAYVMNQNPQSLQQHQAAIQLAEGRFSIDGKIEQRNILQQKQILEQWKASYLKSCK